MNLVQAMLRRKLFRISLRTGLVILMALAVLPVIAWAAAEGKAAADGAAARGAEWADFFWMWFIAFAGSVAALVTAWFFYKKMMAADEGNERMVEIAGYVREGANAYLTQQYKVVACFFVVIAILLAIAAFGLEAQSRWVPFAFLTGGFFSGLAGWFGMKTATWASSRTSAGAQKSLNQGLQVAFRSGAVMGLTVVGLGLLDICLWFVILKWAGLDLVTITVTMLCFGMGASAQALFARVGGGIFTKAADVGADLVGKVEQGIPEDDPRNPATIADNVGDNVGDVAGMGADLYESYCGSILATAALGVAAFSNPELRYALNEGAEVAWTKEAAQIHALFLPMVIAGVGIFLSIAGIFMVRTEEGASQKNLLKALARGINLSTVLVMVAAVVLAIWLMPSVPGTTFLGIPGVAMSVIVGLLAGWVIGKWTEYSTSDEYDPTQKLADQAVTGPATVIIGGVADGMLSVWAPVVVVALGTIFAFGFASGWNFNDINFFALGLYGVGIAAVGMLSTLGITLATDAYGPIADNAGGNAEMAGLEPVVRERTDALDSLGNTTAATGKGFAIGSAALTALALLAAYVEEVRIGFERWGESVIKQDVDTSNLNEADYVRKDQKGNVLGEGKIQYSSFYKASRGFMVGMYKIREKDKKGELVPVKNPRGHEEWQAGYLILKKIQWEEGVATAWEGVGFRDGPERVKTRGPNEDNPLVDFKREGEEPSDVRRDPKASPGKILLTEDYRPAGVYFISTGANLLNNETATLPDFTDFYNASLMNPKVLIGVFLGAMATFVFCAMTMKAVGRAAKGMVEEVRRQFREKPGIMEYKDKPDYAEPVHISTLAAQKEMIVPSVLGLVLPVATGILLGVGGVMGLLVGTLTAGFCVAIFMANAGGSWDNAKKFIEAGAHGGKGTDAHKAAVVGDTVGDPFKDTSGPSLNILIKLMSMVSVVVAGLVVRYSLEAMGIF